MTPFVALFYKRGFTGGSDGKESACNAGDPGSIPGSGRSPGGGHGNSLQYSCLDNPMDRGAWRAIVHGSQRVGHDGVTLTYHKRKSLGRTWSSSLAPNARRAAFKSRVAEIVSTP